MKRLVLLSIILAGCASDPLMSGKPQDWKGHQATEIEAAWGKPTRIMHKPDGSQVWEYLQNGDFVSPQREDTSFRMGGVGTGNTFGAGGGISTVKQPEHAGRYEKIFRFGIDTSGKVKSWYAARVEDGRIVWEDH